MHLNFIDYLYMLAQKPDLISHQPSKNSLTLMEIRMGCFHVCFQDGVHRPGLIVVNFDSQLAMKMEIIVQKLAFLLTVQKFELNKTTWLSLFKYFVE